MRRIADVPTVLRYLSIALFVLAILLFWRMCREPARTTQVRQATGIAAIHIKYRPGMVRYTTMANVVFVRPLFRSHHRMVAAYDDPRDRWVRIEVDARYTQQILDALAHDPAVETAFEPPAV